MEPTCYLDLLPAELKGHLLKFCDGATIIALGSLSKPWEEYIINSTKEVWWNVCTKEIPIDFMLDILVSLYPKMWLKCEVFFSDIFVSWNKWKNPPSDFKLHKLRVHHTPYEITALQFSGTWIFAGTREGEVSAVNIDSGERNIIMNKCGPTLGIQVSRTSLESISTFSGCEHDLLILRSRYYYLFYDLIKGKVIEQYGKLPEFLQLKYFGSQEVRIYNATLVTELKSTCNISHKTYSHRIFDVLSSVLQVWNDSIVLLLDNGRVKVFDFQLRELDHRMNKLVLDHKYFKNRRLVTAHSDVLFFLEEGTTWNGRGFEVIVGNKKQDYRPLQHLGAEVTTLLYHAGNLFLGTGDGFLFLFRVSGDEELLSLDLSAPDYQLNVTENCTVPIIDLAIQEDIHSHFFLAAASINDVFLISSHYLDSTP